MKIFTKVIVFTIIGMPFLAMAQKNENYERIYYLNSAEINTEEATVMAKNIVAEKEYCKLAINIKNNTSDFILFTPAKTKFVYPEMEKQPEGKEVLIKPNKSKIKTLLVNGGDEFLQEKFTVQLGELYKIPVDGKEEEASEFQLPAARNSFMAGDFKVNLVKYSASTKEAKAIFEVQYVGNKMAIVNPSNLSVTANRKKTNELVTYANDYKKSSLALLRNGDKVKMVAVFHIPGKIVDMQFATMNIQWNNTFVETAPELLPAVSFDVEMDKALTEEKK